MTATKVKGGRSAGGGEVGDKASQPDFHHSSADDGLLGPARRGSCAATTLRMWRAQKVSVLDVLDRDNDYSGGDMTSGIQHRPTGAPEMSESIRRRPRRSTLRPHEPVQPRLYSLIIAAPAYETAVSRAKNLKPSSPLETGARPLSGTSRRVASGVGCSFGDPCEVRRGLIMPPPPPLSASQRLLRSPRHWLTSCHVKCLHTC